MPPFPPVMMKVFPLRSGIPVISSWTFIEHLLVPRWRDRKNS
jgi:hypothetical protein